MDGSYIDGIAGDYARYDNKVVSGLLMFDKGTLIMSICSVKILMILKLGKLWFGMSKA